MRHFLDNQEGFFTFQPAGVRNSVNDHRVESDSRVASGSCGSCKTDTDIDKCERPDDPCRPVAGTLSFKKVDFNGNPLQGASFVLRVFETIMDVYFAQSDVNGRVKFCNISPGIYELVEIQTPNGYNIIPISYIVSVSSTGKVTVNGDPADQFCPLVDLPSVFPPGSFAFYKSDGTEPIEGAIFTLYTEPDNLPFTKSTSDSNGLVRFINIPPGTYTLAETFVSRPYIASTDVFDVVVTSDGIVTINGVLASDFANVPFINDIMVITVTLTFFNYGLVIGSVGDPIPLSGGLFELLLENGTSVGTAISASNGAFVFEDVPPGEYILIQLEAPSGWLMGPNEQFPTYGLPVPIRILENGHIYYNNEPLDPFNPPIWLNFFMLGIPTP